ncbi:MAG: AAA family ATPase [bacterium]|nr:AAA family ATPase [bacterium]
MIARVSLDGFNGFTCSYDLGKFTLIIGKVGSGKTSVWQAIQFALSSVSSANMADVFEEHYDRSKTTNRFSVQVTFDDGKEITRMLEKTDKGIVQSFYQDNKSLNRREEAEALKEINISIPTIEELLGKSDQKQIAFLCEKFGDGVEIATLEAGIDNLKEEINKQQKTILNQRGMIDRLEATARAKGEYSDEAFAEVERQIKGITSQIKEMEKIERERMRREREEAIIAEAKANFEAQQAARAVKGIAEEAGWQGSEEQLPGKQFVDANEKTVCPPCECEEVFPAVIEALVIKDADSLPCISCLNTLNSVIEALGKAPVCHKCGAEQMLPIARFSLQAMRKEVKSRGGVA